MVFITGLPVIVQLGDFEHGTDLSGSPSSCDETRHTEYKHREKRHFLYSLYSIVYVEIQMTSQINY